MTRLLFCALLAGAAPALAAQPGADDAPAFAIVLAQTSDGWTAECNTGCDWTRVAIACGRNCTPVLDQHGIYSGASTDRAPGRFAFTVEESLGAELELRPSLRYAHSEAGLRRLADANGFRIAALEHRPVREDQRQPIPGLFFWLEKS